jgi:hypothetical protein
MRTLDFLVIGAAKSGTTTLFHHLSGHPRIFIPSAKEVPFFTNEEWFRRGWTWFVDEFFGSAAKDALWGTVTPRYMADPFVPARIFEQMPEVKLIAILRHPVDRSLSYFRMRIRNGTERRTFEQAVTPLLEQRAAAAARALPLSPESHDTGYLVRSEYGRILDGYLQFFPREQLLVLFTEDLQSDAQGLVERILEFLGLDRSFEVADPEAEHHRGGTRLRFPGLARGASRVAPLRWAWRAIPAETRRGLHLWFRSEANVLPDEARPLEPAFRARLVEYFREDVRRLEAITDRATPWSEFQEPVTGSGKAGA